MTLTDHYKRELSPNKEHVMDTPTKTQSSKEDKLIEACRNELRQIVEEDLNVETLQKIIRLAEVTREILWLRNPKIGKKPRRGRLSLNEMFDDDDDDDDEPHPAVNPANPYHDRETFGVTMAREVVSALRPQPLPASAVEVVRAIAEAQKLGLEDTATQLKHELSRLTGASTESMRSRNMTPGGEP